MNVVISDFPKSALALAIGLTIGMQTPSALAAELTVTNTSASGDGSLAAAIEAANENSDFDNIVFADGVTGDIQVEDSFTISYPLSITGPGSDELTIATNCSGDCGYLFSVEDTAEGDDAITLSGMSLDSINEDFDLGLFRHGGSTDLVFDDVKFKNSTGHTTYGLSSDGGYGGVIYIAQDIDSVTLSNSDISDAETPDCGLICNAEDTSTAEVTIENSTFSDNNSTLIDVMYDVAETSLMVTSSVFTGNTQPIYLYGAEEDSVTITDSTFTGNTRPIYISTSGNVTLSDSRFIENDGSYYSAVQIKTEGSNSAEIIIEDSLFESNTSDYGGALHLGDVDVGTSNKEFIVRNSVFKTNAAGYGEIGALNSSFYNSASSASLLVENSLFEENESGGFSINTYNQGATVDVTIDSSTFSNNNLYTIYSTMSPGVYTAGDSYSLNIVNSTFSGNSVENMTCSNTKNYAAAILLEGGEDTTPITVNILNTTIYNNNADTTTTCRSGIDASLLSDNSTVTIVNSIVAGNTASTGPDIYANSGVVQVDFSLIGDDSDSNLTELTDNNIIGSSESSADPMLDALADNGGTLIGPDADTALPTHNIQDDSPVISAADQSVTNSSLTLPDYDQRGEGYDRIINSLDMGAIEYDSPGPESETDSDSDSESTSSSSSKSSSGGAGGLEFLLLLSGLLGLRVRKTRKQ